MPGTTPWLFGIKEVADVTFTPLDSTDTKVLTFNTLKVSNLEFTSEEAFGVNFTIDKAS